MKRTYKFLVSILALLMLISSIWVLPVSAATVSIQGGNYEVGQSFSIKIQFTADDVLRVVDATVKYDQSKLKVNSVSGADYNVNNGVISLYDEAFDPSANTKNSSYTINFTATAAGSCTITAEVTGGGFADSYATNTATINITTPKPSSNANLSSIKLSAGSLSPAFDPNTLFYDVTVKYDVDEITISATKADGKSTYTGGGTFGLEVGDKNEQVLTVTAEDGTKKTYIVYIKRMTEEETAAYEEEQRNANPLLVVINGKDYTISNDLTDVTIPAGFSQGTATRKESEIAVLNDDYGKYQLCWLVNADGEGAFYSRDEEDNFKKLVYINAGGKMYILEAINIDVILSSDYTFSTCTIDGTEVRTVNYTDEKLKDFNIFNCYVDGKTGYYRLDTVDGTMQRAVDLEISLENNAVNVPVANTQNTENKTGVKNISKAGMLVLGLVALIAVILIVLAIMIIIKIASPKTHEEYGYGDSETNAGDFILGDIDNETVEAENDVPQTDIEPDQANEEYDAPDNSSQLDEEINEPESEAEESDNKQD